MITDACYAYKSRILHFNCNMLNYFTFHIRDMFMKLSRVYVVLSTLDKTIDCVMLQKGHSFI